MPLWRSIAVFRFAALAYVCLLVLRDADRYAHPLAAGAVLLAMLAWSGATAAGYARPANRHWPLLLADLGVVLVVLAVSPWVVGRPALAAGVPTLAVVWLAGPVLAWAVSGGRRRGAVAALALGAADLASRGRIGPSSLTGVILLLLAGVIVGHVARLAVTAEERLHRAVQLEAATRERERLARGIHDSVLQVLALVQRRGAHLDGEAGELARLAGEQEAALRALIAGVDPAPAADEATGTLDLRALLGRYASATVSVSAPATPVPLPAPVARELAAATAAALDNVRRHADGRAWVLVEDEGETVTVSVRDAGPGIGAGRLVEAARQGRLGMSQSIRGRIADLGGEVRIVSASGEGTEVELVVPREDG
ncbi:Signal transduction histidine kinase [Micromonospora purpureochromogenes]|uniref:Signal transduction histidine kinase n=1 Tax=Micromonospora purpureochromogenes TaxID=47872 RepID=A0A1C4W294_9ACTN|nr:Signal transduction histidine kinase [Micromonospora purpureochromogenes]